VFGHARRKRSAWSAFRGSGGFRKKHGIPIHPASTSSTRQRPRGFLRARCCRRSTVIRPTDFCHPTNLPTCTRARGSRPISRPRGMSPGARWIEGHDVSRRRRPLPPDRTLRPRVFTEVASCDRASDTPVARSWGRAAIADGSRLRSFEPRPPSSFFREEKDEWTIRRVFLR
jgi:hypothetical protein